jgi:hypothetical protein
MWGRMKSKHLYLNFEFSSILTNTNVSFPSGKGFPKFGVESDMKQTFLRR